MLEEMLLVEKYRPKTVADTILPKNLKALFANMVKKDQIPTLLLTGGPGVGKTTVAKAMLTELGHDYIVINGSLESGIDTLRHSIQTYASTVSMTGGRKYVILDEADHLNPNSFQPALRNFIETFSKNCGFILTCNYPNKILKEIKSRCAEIDFVIPKDERASIAMQYVKRIYSILDTEGIEYEKAVIQELVLKYFPDFRQTLGEIQKYSVVGKIDTGILHNSVSIALEELIGYLRTKNFTATRTWVGEHNHIPAHELFRTFYRSMNKLVTPSSIPALVILLSKYQYQAAFVVDQEINTAAFLLEVMSDVTFV